jgi:AraC-like DNA-binding protein
VDVTSRATWDGAARRGRAAATAARWRIESERWCWPRAGARPHPGLRRFLARDYWGVTAQTAPHRLLVPATVSVPLVLKLEDSPYRPPAFLHGVHDRYSILDGDCARSYLEIHLAPLGAYRLLGHPIHELGAEVLDLEAVLGAAARRLLEAVREEPSWPRRFALLDDFLLFAADRGPSPAPEVARAWQLLAGDGGTTAISIAQVADEVGWSHKHLITKFTAQIGLTPKTVSRLARFERLLARVRASRQLPEWGQVAADCGYADQSHLIREFRDFAGTTPTDYLHRVGR